MIQAGTTAGSKPRSAAVQPFKRLARLTRKVELPATAGAGGKGVPDGAGPGAEVPNGMGEGAEFPPGEALRGSGAGGVAPKAVKLGGGWTTAGGAELSWDGAGDSDGGPPPKRLAKGAGEAGAAAPKEGISEAPAAGATNGEAGFAESMPKGEG